MFTREQTRSFDSSLQLNENTWDFHLIYLMMKRLNASRKVLQIDATTNICFIRCFELEIFFKNRFRNMDFQLCRLESGNENTAE